MEQPSNKKQFFTNYLFLALVACVVLVAGYLFKVQSGQVDQLTRIVESQRVEIAHFRRQVKALSDEELQAKSKQDAATAIANAAAKQASEASALALAAEENKLKALIQERQKISGVATSAANSSSEQDERAHLKRLQDDLKQFSALQNKDRGILNSVNSDSQVAHKVELTALKQRHKDRATQIKNDQSQINRFNQQITALSRQRKSNSAAAGEISSLTTALRQTELDLNNLRSTDQTDQENYNRAKQGFDANTSDTKNEIKNERTDLQQKIKNTRAEIESLQKHLSKNREKQGVVNVELADIDAQIKTETERIEEMKSRIASAVPTVISGAAAPVTAATAAAPKN